MAELNPKNEEPKKKRQFSQKQYDMLKRCSDKQDMTEWNEWRKDHKKEDVLLEGASLSGVCLKGANLGTLQLRDSETNAPLRAEVYLKGANLEESHLEGADLQFAHLEDAYLNWTRLEDAKLMNADLRNAKLHWAHLERAGVAYAHLEGAIFEQATVDGSTSLWECRVNRETNFLGVSLDVAKIDPGTRQLLEYNIRRMNWEEWYPKHRVLRWPVRRFWKISDYGLSTKQIIWTFFKWALVFAAVYYVWGFVDYYFVCMKDYPGIVSNLFVLEDKREAVSHWLVPFRAVYFSIVTMTTLGFGDMYANAHSFLRGLFGHVLLAFQVILGYVLLGALVTRFAVLFTAGGPAGEFSKKNEATEATKKRTDSSLALPQVRSE